MQSFKIHIRGKVHKTGLLYFIKQRAFENNIKGSVFYYADHSIGLFAEGEKQDMDAFIEICRNGKPESLIESFNINQNPIQGFTSFEVLDNIPQLEPESEILI